VTTETASRPTSLLSGYSSGDRPLGSYAALTATYATGTATMLYLARRSGRLPEAIGPLDVALLGVATHKISRELTKDKVLGFVRAPFTRVTGSGPPGEIDEEPRGTGARRAIGELLTCPYCISQWVATGLAGGLIFAPRTTRVIAAVFAAKTAADFVQARYRDELGD
jgi:hypothetical protein